MSRHHKHHHKHHHEQYRPVEQPQQPQIVYVQPNSTTPSPSSSTTPASFLHFFGGLPNLIKTVLVIAVLGGLFYIGYVVLWPLLSALGNVLGFGSNVLNTGVDTANSLLNTGKSVLTKLTSDPTGAAGDAIKNVVSLPTGLLQGGVGSATDSFKSVLGGLPGL